MRLEGCFYWADIGFWLYLYIFCALFNVIFYIKLILQALCSLNMYVIHSRKNIIDLL